jgi:hypothetical protein
MADILSRRCTAAPNKWNGQAMPPEFRREAVTQTESVILHIEAHLAGDTTTDFEDEERTRSILEVRSQPLLVRRERYRIHTKRLAAHFGVVRYCEERYCVR